MKAFIFEILLVGVLSGFISEVWADAAVAPARPSCDLVETQIVVLNNQLKHSGQALADLNKSLKWTNAGYIISDIAQGVATVASMFVGASALEGWAVKTGLPLLTKLFTAGRLTTAAAAGAGLIIMIDGKQVYASNAIEARTWIDSRLQELEQKATSGGNMLLEKDVEEVFSSLGAWYKKAEAANADNDKLGITEFWSHAEGKRLSEIRIPFVEDTIRVLKLKLAIFQGQALACAH
ncbi:MAG: hypothetical protein HY074_16415 [Deltaproteobacteria bacterium]|nr:hypothetical protein [Deltaproteobacteria bacterium]